LPILKVKYLWFEASPYIGNGYNIGLAEGGHKTTAKHKGSSENIYILYIYIVLKTLFLIK
jgi:hypothetical protein